MSNDPPPVLNGLAIPWNKQKKEEIGQTEAYITAISAHHTYMNKNHAFRQKVQ